MINKRLYERFFGPLRSEIEDVQKRDLVDRAIQDNVMMTTSRFGGGTLYTAQYDGYRLSYVDCYDEDTHQVELYKVVGKPPYFDLNIYPMSCPDFLNDDEWFIKLLNAVTDKYPDSCIHIVSKSWRKNVLKQIEAIIC